MSVTCSHITSQNKITKKVVGIHDICQKKVPQPQFSRQKNYAKNAYFETFGGQRLTIKYPFFTTRRMTPGKQIPCTPVVTVVTNLMYDSQHLKMCTIDSLINKKIPNANTLVMHNFLDSGGMKNVCFLV